MYVDISHQIEHFIPAEKRPEHFIHRGDRDYLMFKPVARTLEEAIALYETRAYEKYAAGARPATHYTPHMLQLLEFQQKMEGVVPWWWALPAPPTTPRPWWRCSSSCAGPSPSRGPR